MGGGYGDLTDILGGVHLANLAHWGDIPESPLRGGAPSAGGYIGLSYSAVGFDPSGGSATPAPPLASSSRLSLAISASYLSSV